jgi:hypothetical protein
MPPSRLVNGGSVNRRKIAVGQHALPDAQRLDRNAR